LCNIYATNYHGYIPFVVITIPSFPYSWHITMFITWVTQHVPLVEQELFILPEHQSSLHVYWRSCCSIFSFLCSVVEIIFCPFSFGHCIVCPLVSSNFSVYCGQLHCAFQNIYHLQKGFQRFARHNPWITKGIITQFKCELCIVVKKTFFNKFPRIFLG
jgi:hypothetical protein